MATNIELDNFMEKSKERDVGLQVGDTLFWVSRRKLVECSAEFKNLINISLVGNMFHGQSENDPITIKLEEELDEILEFLRCLFPVNGQPKSIDKHNVEYLVRLGDKYGIKNLIDGCVEFLKTTIHRSRSIKEISKCVDLAAQYKMKAVVRGGVHCLSTHEAKSLFAEQLFGNLPLNIRYAVITVRSLRQSGKNYRKHDMEDVSEDLNDCVTICRRPDRDPKDLQHDDGGSRCTLCDYEECGCEYCSGRDRGQCPICRYCKKKYDGSGNICKCIEQMIETELEKAGL